MQPSRSNRMVCTGPPAFHSNSGLPAQTGKESSGMWGRGAAERVAGRYFRDGLMFRDGWSMRVGQGWYGGRSGRGFFRHIVTLSHILPSYHNLALHRASWICVSYLADTDLNRTGWIITQGKRKYIPLPQGDLQLPPNQ